MTTSPLPLLMWKPARETDGYLATFADGPKNWHGRGNVYARIQQVTPHGWAWSIMLNIFEPDERGSYWVTLTGDATRTDGLSRAQSLATVRKAVREAWRGLNR